jgi:magnesium transporter
VRVLQAREFVSGDGTARDVDIDDALESARGGRKRDGILWIDTEDPSDDDLDRLDEALRLGELLLEDLREGSEDLGQRTKLLRHGAVFHVAVNDCTVVGRDLVRRELDLLFGPGWLCSVRHSSEVADDPDPFPMDDVRRRLEAQCRHEAQLDEGFILWAFLDLVADRYFGITDAIDDRLDAAESHLDEDDGRRSSSELSPRELFETGRLLTGFRRQVIPLREVVGALLRREDPAIGESALTHLRDVYDHLLGIVELAESQRDVIAGLRDAHLAVISNNMNRSMQTLTAWGAILIVATLITGVLGMNFRDQPNVSWPIGFAAVVGVIMLLTLPLYVYFKKKGWL